MSKDQKDPVIESAHRKVAALTEVEEEMRDLLRNGSEADPLNDQVRAAAGSTLVQAIMAKHQIDMEMMHYVSMRNMADDGRSRLTLPV